MSSTASTPDPQRFEVRPLTLWTDRFMTSFIKLGGVLVIVAVLGIFLFIALQVIPLFRGAAVAPLRTLSLPPGPYGLIGSDEWGDLPFAVASDGRIVFAPADGAPVQEHRLREVEGRTLTALQYNERLQKVVAGMDDGRALLVSPGFRTTSEDGRRRTTANPSTEALPEIGLPGVAIRAIALGEDASRRLVAVVQEQEGRAELHVREFTRRRSLMGPGKFSPGEALRLTPLLTGAPTALLVPTTGDSVVVLTEQGEVNYLFRTGEGRFERRQSFRPFADLPDPSVAAMAFLQGDVSVVFADAGGVLRVYSLALEGGGDRRVFGFRREFSLLEGRPSLLAANLRNKAFLAAAGQSAALLYNTTATVRWQAELPFVPAEGVFNGKFTRLVFRGEDDRLHLYKLDDPHPEAGWQAFFGRLWYEGYAEPAWAWQSTGGSDDFEPKLSLVPLVFGTLKGTVYALLFAVPIALLAAVYTSQFLDPRQRAVVKPVMEIMASLPSVVLGFLAALWLAPRIETKVPSLLLVVAGVPLAVLLFGFCWSRLPTRLRHRIPPGLEALAILPVLLGAGWVFWQLGPAFERLAFTVTDPQTGARVADFRAWWPAATGTPFVQRNSLVVGFMMGFAVIPIIFTISEDAMSNVPGSLRSASLALGASRWQTALYVVLPTASAGMFSAVMIGLGRAVGETMIVVMATGNTPVMEWNIFSGMRTLSANIAVELPEAPQFSTLYRTLFFGALLLFLFTFVLNTLAEILRQHLREKYKTV